MSNLQDLYQELIIDHSRSPHNFGRLEPADFQHEGFNPLCGDKVILYLRKNDGKIQEVQFEGSGCAISMASASMMTDVLIGKTPEEIVGLFSDFHYVVTHGQEKNSNPDLEKLMALAGVAQFPMRVKCATLAWHTMLAALKVAV